MNDNLTGSVFVIPSIEEVKNWDRKDIEKLFEEGLNKISEIETSDPFYYGYMTNQLIWGLLKKSEIDTRLMKVIELRIKLFPLIFGKTKSEDEKRAIQMNGYYRCGQLLINQLRNYPKEIEQSE